MEAVYGLLGVDRGVPEVWGSVYDIRELLDSTVKLMDGKSPLDIELPGPLNALKLPLLRAIKGTIYFYLFQAISGRLLYLERIRCIKFKNAPAPLSGVAMRQWIYIRGTVAANTDTWVFSLHIS